MNCPKPIKQALSHADNVRLCERAGRIADRIAPMPPRFGFSAFDPRERSDFIARCNMIARRNRVYREVFQKLQAKALRGKPLSELMAGNVRGWVQ